MKKCDKCKSGIYADEFVSKKGRVLCNPCSVPVMRAEIEKYVTAQQEDAEKIATLERAKQSWYKTAQKLTADLNTALEEVERLHSKLNAAWVKDRTIEETIPMTEAEAYHAHTGKHTPDITQKDTTVVCLKCGEACTEEEHCDNICGTCWLKIEDAPTYYETLYFDFLVDLRDSGVTNMWGAGTYLEDEFGMDEKTAREWLIKWIKSFD